MALAEFGQPLRIGGLFLAVDPALPIGPLTGGFLVTGGLPLALGVVSLIAVTPIAQGLQGMASTHHHLSAALHEAPQAFTLLFQRPPAPHSGRSGLVSGRLIVQQSAISPL